MVVVQENGGLRWGISINTYNGQRLSKFAATNQRYIQGTY